MSPTKSTAIPDDLAELDRWAIWRLENGRKVPYRSHGRRADSTDRGHWGAVEEAQQALLTGSYDGLGFAFFPEDGLVGGDLDNCLEENGDVRSWAVGIVERFSDTY